MSGVAASECTQCELGKYAGETSSFECTRCDDEIPKSTTFVIGATGVGDCQCRKKDFLNTDKGKCEPVMEGVDGDFEQVSGRRSTRKRTSSEFVQLTILQTKQATLGSLPLVEGYWRTTNSSTDVRPCPTQDSCLGGTDLNLYCADGHQGPYCNICKSGLKKDIFGACQECEDVGSAVGVTCGILAGFGLLFFMLWKCYCRMMEKHAKQTRNGMQAAKISIVTFQILAFLPSVIPNMPLPDAFSAFLSSITFFKFDFISMLNLGCVYENM